MWLNPAYASSNAPNVSYNLPPAPAWRITHLMIRAAPGCDNPYAWMNESRRLLDRYRFAVDRNTGSGFLHVMYPGPTARGGLRSDHEQRLDQSVSDRHEPEHSRELLAAL